MTMRGLCMKEVWAEIWEGLKTLPDFRYLLIFLAFGLAGVLLTVLFSCMG
jgi:hypothetical protein